MTAYYNEFDPKAAAWLRELIKAGLIAPGVVDERSIEDVTPNDLAGFTQCHFFAGIGVWSYALYRAGWSDDRPVWTGSCPCQPFSAAGKGAGFADERHLWPAFHHLIKQCKPTVVFGEQVASKAVDDWIDLVHADLEAVGYAFGSVPFPSAGVGAPHIRDRNFWVAESASDGRTGGRQSRTIEARPAAGRNAERSAADERGELSAGLEGSGLELLGGVADSDEQQWNGRGDIGTRGRRELANDGATSRMGNNNNPRLEGLGSGHQTEGGRVGAVGSVAEAGESGWMGDASRATSERYAGSISGTKAQEHGERIAVDVGMSIGLEHASASVGRLADMHGDGLSAGIAIRPDGEEHDAKYGGNAGIERPGPTNGFWRDADWLGCRDGKWRPVEPGTFPLAHGAAARVGRLRGYGNAINAEAATAFIEAWLGI